MQVVITGGNGFIAKKICQNLLRKGCVNVRGVVQPLEKIILMDNVRDENGFDDSRVGKRA